MFSIIRKILWWLTLVLLLWLAGLSWFTAQIPAHGETQNTQNTDAIVVLTGGGGRLESGLRLLAEGKGKKLFITGVGQGITIDQLIATTPEPLRSSLAAFTPDIVLGHEAENTIGNAEETARFVQQQGYTSIRLVTSDYHMPRSLEEFAQLMPAVTIIASPVYTDDYSPANWWREPDSRMILLSEYHKFIAAKFRHWFLWLAQRQ